MPAFGIGVVLAEVQRRRHIHNLADGCRAESTPLEFRNNRRHQSSFIENPFGNKNFSQQASHRLRHRHGRVLASFIQASEVALVDDAPFMQDQDAVGVVGRQRLLPGHLSITTDRLERNRVDTGVRLARKRHRRAKTAADLRRRQEFPEMADRPAHLGEAEIIRIGLPDQLVRGRWKSLHPSQRLRVRSGGAGRFACLGKAQSRRGD